MLQGDGRVALPLYAVVQEAMAALVQMDTERLEELAQCCADLNREGREAVSAADLQGVEGDVRLLGRILYETRANLTVLTRLHAIRQRESGPRLRPALAEMESRSAAWTNTLDTAEGKTDYGDN